MRRPPLTSRLAGFGTSVFAEMTDLARRHGAVNLGQGYPDFDGPEFVKQAAVAALRAGHNQYAPMPGLPALQQAVADHQKRFYGLEHDPAAEVTIHAGATEALCATLAALLDPGDEAIVLEPFYDAYLPGIALAESTARVVALASPELRLDAAALEAAVSPRTRLLVLNSPNNPAGRVFTREELGAIADVCVRHDLLVVTDEVYEHLTFDGRAHIPLATLPGMAERTVTISSGGKTFSVTGWKVGWLHARRDLVDAITTVKQFLTYVNAGPFQPAVAAGLDLPAEFFLGVAGTLQAGRDLLVEGLRAAGFGVRVPEGTYFIVADAAPLGYHDGLALCRDLPRLAGVVAVPMRVFYDDQDAGRSLVRFACCKRPEVLREAADRLGALRR